MTSEGDKRKLVDLRVVDLRAELEKRGLDNKGVKATLIERLQKVLRDEGHDPEEYLFDIEPVKTPKRTSMKRGEQDTESETHSNADENHDTTMEVDEEGKEKEEEEEEEKIENGKENDSKESSEKSGKTEENTEIVTESTTKSEEKFEEQCESSTVTADGDKSVPEANGVDNEDSINLTIGEDEEKLLADEVGHEEDSSSQEKEVKDEGERGGVNPEEGTAVGDGKKQAAGQEEDKDTAGEDGKQEKAQEENRDDKGGDKGKSSLANADQKPSKDDKEKRAKSAATTGSSRNLWVSGLSSSTRATDLKQVFSKYGKVIGAKVVTNARTPGARCYGYVTMATSEDASKCIQHLHRTELHGRMISVERAKGDAAGPPKKGADGRPVAGKKVDEKKRHERKLSTSSKTEDKKSDKEDKGESGKSEADGTKDDEGKQGDETKEKEECAEGEEKEKDENEEEKDGGERRHSSDKPRSRDVSHDRRERHRSAGSSHYSHHSRPHSRSPHRRVFRPGSPSRRPGVLTFTQIREERERQRLRERERELREEDRRRREEMARQREIERRQREEAARLEREKERLRLERERIEAERAELMRLERERQRLEREKLEREREELKRQQMRFEEARRTTKRPSDDRRDSYGEDRKRVATERRYEGSQSSRFEDETRSNDFQGKKEYKHGGEFAGRRNAGGKFEGSNYDQDSRTPRGEGMVMKKDPSHELPRRDHTVQDVGRGKDGRFERGPSFRVRDERRPESDHRPKVDMRHSARERYPDSAKGEGRYSERSGDSWHAGGGPPPVKPFSSLSGSGVPSRDSWGASGDRKSDGGQSWGRPMESSSSDRWVSGGSGPMGVVGRSGPSMGGPGSIYTSQQNVPPNPPGMNMGMSSSGPYGADRFDSYKQSMGPIRKY
ncbi:hypothetical protein R5R35_000431 [Gryllus longicercus]|uniref:SAFB-like transcription modulator n=1 Tax=Gryllus longicercus TaxID=2509291 RepID=A0AAN9YX54_9ORTH